MYYIGEREKYTILYICKVQMLREFQIISKNFTHFKKKIVMWEIFSKGPGAKNDASESPGCFNQILTFESRKWSRVATF